MAYFHVIWGSVSSAFALLSFIPALTFFTWVTYPVAALGMMFAWFSLENQSIRAHALTGFLLNIAAIVIALIHTIIILVLGSRLY
jgi:hypothetical protein